MPTKFLYAYTTDGCKSWRFLKGPKCLPPREPPKVSTCQVAQARSSPVCLAVLLNAVGIDPSCSDIRDLRTNTVEQRAC